MPNEAMTNASSCVSPGSALAPAVGASRARLRPASAATRAILVCMGCGPSCRGSAVVANDGDERLLELAAVLLADVLRVARCVEHLRRRQHHEIPVADDLGERHRLAGVVGLCEEQQV